jgi:hypothetical protein
MEAAQVIARLTRVVRDAGLAESPTSEIQQEFQHIGATAMLFMVIVKATKETEAGGPPDPEGLAEMGKFNEELIKAGVIVAMEGLHPSSKGARVRISDGKRTVIDGPFAEAKELVAGFWLWRVSSKEEAIEWVKRCSMFYKGESEVEIREVWEMKDVLSEERIERKERLRAQLSNKS